jgi:HK97 family phage major capsid protein/HK97 family phage prohead protease
MPTPTKGIKEDAQRGLDWRREFGRGGTEVGIARARDIVNGKNLSDSTVKRMYSFFSRHEVDKKGKGFNQGEEGYPSNGRIAWALWGGDAGFSWSKRLVEQMKDDERSSDLVDNNDNIPVINEVKQMERHVVNVEETEDSFIIELAKADTGEEVEIVDEVQAETAEYEEMAEDVERANPSEIVYRTVDLSRGSIDEEKRIVRIGVSSESPVERDFGLEVLSHKKEDIDMEFMASGRAPLLNNHKMDEQIGVVRSFYLDETQRRTVALVEFGKSALAQEVFEDVKSGIKQNISVGYSVKKLVRAKDDEGKEYYRASWTPMEASIVSIPADASKFVGVGRSSEKTLNTNKVETMTEETQVDVRQVSESAKAEALASVSEIIALGKHHNQRDLAEKAIERGVTVEQFRGELLEAVRNDQPLETPAAVVDVAKSEQREYSLIRAIKAASSGDWREAGYEREISDEIAHRSGKEARGFYLPANINWAQRDQTAGTNSAGGFLVGTDHLADQFIEALYARLTITSLGARVMQGLKGDVAIPKLSASVTNSAFVAEGSAPSEGAATFAQVTMSPKTLAAYVDVSRRLTQQSDPSVEQVLRNDIINTFARKIDDVAIEGGASNAPSGIIANSDTNVVAMGTNGAAITYAKVVELMKAVEEDNAMINNSAFLTNPKVIAALRTVSKQASGVEGNFIMDPNGTILGTDVASSTLVPSDLSKGTGSNLSAMIYGDFSQIMLGFWSGVDVVVDQSSLSTSGGTRLAFFQDLDVALRYPESFAVIKDIVAS